MIKFAGRVLGALVLTAGALTGGSADVAAAADLVRVVPGLGMVAEGNLGSTELRVPVRLSAASAVIVTVQWRTVFGPGVGPPDPADPFFDFTAASGTVTFEPGQTEKTVSVVIRGDTLPEPDEFVVVQFGNPTNARMGGYWGLGFGIIENDDVAPLPPPSIVPPRPWAPNQVGDVSVVEGADGTEVDAELRVRLSRASDLTVTVAWTTFSIVESGLPTATAGVDYESASGTLTFAPGVTEAVVPITIYGDDVAEPDEDVVVIFDRPTNAVLGGTVLLGGLVSVSSILIVDDDKPAA